MFQRHRLLVHRRHSDSSDGVWNSRLGVPRGRAWANGDRSPPRIEQPESGDVLPRRRLHRRSPAGSTQLATGVGSPSRCAAEGRLHRRLRHGSTAPLGIGGGIPAVSPTNFGDGQFVTDALNDYACRFTFTNASSDACSRNANGNFSFLGSQTREQYCYNTDVIAAFPEGDTMVTVQVLDTSGVPGPTSRIIVRVPTPSP